MSLAGPDVVDPHCDGGCFADDGLRLYVDVDDDDHDGHVDDDLREILNGVYDDDDFDL